MKIINSTRHLPAKLATAAIRRLTRNRPIKVVVNKENKYLACWAGSHELWLEVVKAETLWSIVVASSWVEMKYPGRSFFSPKDPEINIYDALVYYIALYSFKFQ